MIGGNVIEIIDLPEKDKIWINCKEIPYNGECAIYLKRNETSLKISNGDMIWWQGNFAYWTPKSYTKKETSKCSIDYEIKIERIGCSGVSRPKI